MAVYFVLRSHYDEPSGKHLRRFPDATVLDWFRRLWNFFEPDDLREQIIEMLGWYVDPLIDLFAGIQSNNAPVPENTEQLAQYFQEFTVCDELRCETHALTLFSTDDCNMESCVYLFDDVYLADHRDRVAFLLHEGWQLPAGHADVSDFHPSEPVDSLTPRGDGSGATYFICLHYDYENDGNLTELWGPARIEGVRVPELASYLALLHEGIEDRFLLLLRAQLFAGAFTLVPMEEQFRESVLHLGSNDPALRRDAELALFAYSDWCKERQDRTPGLIFLEHALQCLTYLPVAHLPDCEFGPIGATCYQIVSDLERGKTTSKMDGSPLANSEGDEYPSPENCHIHVEEHLAQLCLNTEHWRTFHRADLYHQWFIFDDLWATAHPVLANALLAYASRWDVL